MSRIHYFQRYSTAENTVTNNTLLLLARIYEHSPRIASGLISELTGESIQIGIEVAQQKRGQGSVPDGLIIQRSFKLLIEAKVDAPVNVPQLLRHAASFQDEGQKILLLLVKRVDEDIHQEIHRRLREDHPGVAFKTITYERICELTRSLFREHESQMRDLVEDYEEYCNDLELFDQSDRLMRVVPCGRSLEINKRYHLYFHPNDRSYTEHKFIGIYSAKRVQAILEPQAVLDVTIDNGQLRKTLIKGQENGEFDQAILNAIRDAEVECGFNLTSGTQFFCGTMALTDFRKTSPYGIQGSRLLNLERDLNLDPSQCLSAATVAGALMGKEWS